jgi:hypothetical protein
MRVPERCWWLGCQRVARECQRVARELVVESCQGVDRGGVELGLEGLEGIGWGSRGKVGSLLGLPGGRGNEVLLECVVGGFGT